VVPEKKRKFAVLNYPGNMMETRRRVAKKLKTANYYQRLCDAQLASAARKDAAADIYSSSEDSDSDAEATALALETDVATQATLLAHFAQQRNSMGTRRRGPGTYLLLCPLPHRASTLPRLTSWLNDVRAADAIRLVAVKPAA
jgi:hypothetical protein